MVTSINFIRSIKAEWIKSRSRAVIGLMLFCIAFVIAIVLVAGYMDVYNRVAISKNPWDRFFIGGLAIYILFVMAPFVILLISAIFYIEEKANGWKFMYTLNISRTQTYISKLLVISFLILVSSAIIGLLLILAGYGLDSLLPEYEFSYYIPNISFLLETITRAFISCLGAIALQFMISIITNNVILSLGIGVFTYIIAFIQAFSATSTVLYNPFALIMINQDFGAIDLEYRKYLIEGILTNVELYSILFFVLFTTIGCIYESGKNIKG